jgi:nitronate monooxygenase
MTLSPSAQRLAHLLGTRFPLIQAPMAGLQGHVLAAAVTAAGALGSVPAATLTADGLRIELQALTDRIGVGAAFNVNFFCHVALPNDVAVQQHWLEVLAPQYQRWGLPMPDAASLSGSRAPYSPAIAEVVAPFRPRVVSFHFGLPDAALVAQAKSWGAVVLASATTLAEGLWLQAHGADAVIAQGLEAGGHRGHFLLGERTPSDAWVLAEQMGTFALVPQLVAALKVPVIAAGGIADAAGVRAALALGAAGVQVGTAYLLSPEATTSAVHRAALQGPHAAHTALTHLFTGRPARGIVNAACANSGLCPLPPQPFPWLRQAWHRCARLPNVRARMTFRRCGQARTPAPPGRFLRRKSPRNCCVALPRSEARQAHGPRPHPFCLQRLRRHQPQVAR